MTGHPVPDQEVPYVWVSPGRRGGRPCVGGHRLETDLVAGLVWDGPGGIGLAADTWQLTRGEVLIACWYEAVNGRYRVWRQWAEQAVGWHEPDGIPDPPCRPCDCRWANETLGDDGDHRCREPIRHEGPHRCGCEATEEVVTP